MTADQTSTLVGIVRRLVIANLVADIVYLSVYFSVQSDFESGKARCEGIGFGCTPGPGFQAALWGGLALVVGVIIALVAGRFDRDVGNRDR